MRLSLYPAGKGDCLLVTADDGRRLLVDGGTADSFREYVAPSLARLGKIDVVCISHIDDDHIAGVLQLLDDSVAWRVYDYQRRHHISRPRPTCPRPPIIKRIWHNAFAEQIGKNAGPIQSMLAATAAVLEGAEQPRVRTVAESQRELAASIGQALRVSRRVSPEQLKIPLNPEYDGRLMVVVDPPIRIRLGRMKVVVLGPFEEDLRKLRGEWNQWLRDNQRTLTEIRRESREVGPDLGQREVELLLRPLLVHAQRLGDRGRVTTPNLASLMLLLEEGSSKVLLTGDGHAREVLRGLERAGRLDARDGMHVDILKVQHHGSEYNIDADFCKAITADHYVLSANGAHNNPDLRALEAIIASRLGSSRQRSLNAEATDRFTIWFNSSSSVTEATDDKTHMRGVERLLVRRANPRMRVKFRTKPNGIMRVL